MSALCVIAGGCAPRWRPPLDNVVSGQAGLRVELADYLAPPGVTRVFTRRNLLDPADPSRRYVRHSEGNAVQEGQLIGRVDPADLAKLSPDTDAAPFAEFEWPEIEDGIGAGFFLEFDPPVPRYPPFLAPGLTLVYESAIRYYDWRGRFREDAAATRTAVWEGLEDLPDRPGCLRIRIETDFRMGWGTRVRVTEYVWLARGFGEIRRVERLEGYAFLLPFEAAYEYTLTGGNAAARTASPPGQSPDSVASPASPPGEWRRCAVFLDRTYPRPRLAGVAVELAH